MAKREGLRFTKAQEGKLFAARVGYGVAGYKLANNMTASFEFFIDRKNRMCYIGNGKPVEFEVTRDEDGDEICAAHVGYDNDATIDPTELYGVIVGLKEQINERDRKLEAYAIDKDNAEKALGWKGVSLADSESVAAGIEKLYAKLTEQYMHEGGIPQVMTKYILLTWLAALNIPRVVDTTATNIPNVFYVTFANKLTGSEEQQIGALGITLTHVDGTHVRGHYMLKWNTPRKDEL